MFFSIKKKRIVYSLLAIIPILIFGIVFIVYNSLSEDNELVQDIQQVNTGIEMILDFETHYVVGEDLLETKTEFVKSIDEIKDKYPDWEVIEVNDNRIMLSRNVEDISPECKNRTYFSLNSDGYLTLFSGDPNNKSNENPIIETFFRIDIDKLESSLPSEPVEELYDGILIQDLAEFNSVLSTFSEFSID